MEAKRVAAQLRLNMAGKLGWPNFGSYEYVNVIKHDAVHQCENYSQQTFIRLWHI